MDINYIQKIGSMKDCPSDWGNEMWMVWGWYWDEIWIVANQISKVTWNSTYKIRLDERISPIIRWNDIREQASKHRNRKSSDIWWGKRTFVTLSKRCQLKRKWHWHFPPPPFFFWCFVKIRKNSSANEA